MMMIVQFGDNPGDSVNRMAMAIMRIGDNDGDSKTW